MLQRYELEVDYLDPRPDHPILRQRRPVCFVQSLLRLHTLHGGHAAQEDEHVGWRENELVKSESGGNLGIGAVGDLDFILEEFEPGGRCGPEDGTTVQRHPPCPSEAVILKADLLHGLLRQHITSREQYLMSTINQLHSALIFALLNEVLVQDLGQAI